MGRYYPSYDLTAEEAKALREHFKIDPALSGRDAKKIMVVRNELAVQGTQTTSQQRCQRCVLRAIIPWKARIQRFSAVDVIAESVRYYPNGTTASHILGYLGKISESERVI